MITNIFAKRILRPVCKESRTWERKFISVSVLQHQCINSHSSNRKKAHIKLARSYKQGIVEYIEKIEVTHFHHSQQTNAVSACFTPSYKVKDRLILNKLICYKMHRIFSNFSRYFKPLFQRIHYVYMIYEIMFNFFLCLLLRLV